MWNWSAVVNGAFCELCDEAEGEDAPPAVTVHVVPNEAGTRVGLVAADNARGENTSMRSDIPKRDVLHCDQRLGRASSVAPSEWIEHASWTAATWLFLLLGPDVDIPPEWLVDQNVRVGNV